MQCGGETLALMPLHPLESEAEAALPTRRGRRNDGAEIQSSNRQNGGQASRSTGRWAAGGLRNVYNTLSSRGQASSVGRRHHKTGVAQAVGIGRLLPLRVSVGDSAVERGKQGPSCSEVETLCNVVCHIADA